MSTNEEYTFARRRLTMWRSFLTSDCHVPGHGLRRHSSLSAMDEPFRAWVANKLDAGVYLGWFALDGDQVIAGAGLWLTSGYRIPTIRAACAATSSTFTPSSRIASRGSRGRWSADYRLLPRPRDSRCRAPRQRSGTPDLRGARFCCKQRNADAFEVRTNPSRLRACSGREGNKYHFLTRLSQ